MSGFDTDFALIREAVERSCNCAVAAECDCTDDALAAVDRLRVTLTATENALAPILVAVTANRHEASQALLDDSHALDPYVVSRRFESIEEDLNAVLAAARVVVSADPTEED